MIRKKWNEREDQQNDEQLWCKSQGKEHEKGKWDDGKLEGWIVPNKRTKISLGVKIASKQQEYELKISQVILEFS